MLKPPVIIGPFSSIGNDMSELVLTCPFASSHSLSDCLSAPCPWGPKLLPVKQPIVPLNSAFTVLSICVLSSGTVYSVYV